MSQLQNTEISGIGRISGGTYNKIGINGAGTVLGAVEAVEITISGRGKMDGAVKAGQFTVNGSGSVKGSLRAETFENYGSTGIQNTLEATKIHNRGRVSVKEYIVAADIDSSGELVCSSDVEAQFLQIKGKLHIGGTLETEYGRVVSSRTSFVHQWIGDSISVKKGNWNSGVLEALRNLFGIRRDHIFKANVIEGKQISLEYTEVKHVKGDKVTIGPNCRLEKLECKELVDIDPSSRVGSIIYF